MTRSVHSKAAAVIACLSVPAVLLSAAPAQADGWDCPEGYSCYYDGFDGQNRLFRADRCGPHDLRGGPYQNRINSVHNNNGSKGVHLDIWKNVGGWTVYDYIHPYEWRNVPSNDIDRIRIEC